MIGKTFIMHHGALLMCVAAVPATYVAHKPIHRVAVAVKHRVNQIAHRQVFAEPRVRAPRIETDMALCPSYGGGYGGGFGGGGLGGGGYYGGSGGGFSGGGLSINPAPPIIPGGSIFTPSVPEPATWLQMGAGLAVIGGVMRYRRHRANAVSQDRIAA